MPIRVVVLIVIAACAGNAGAQTPEGQAPADDVVHHAESDDQSHAPSGALYGSYPVNREVSGTAWQPDSSPMPGLHFGSGSWSFMAHGFINGMYTSESGPRGDKGSFATGMVMVSARRGLPHGALGLRAMITGEPAMGSTGYPFLLQTGETADGLTPLVDRQHPHDMLMELAATWSRGLAAGSSFFIYLAPVGEPPIGPSAFMHRPSALGSPLPPISHHFLDSTHIAHGVVTVGIATAQGLKLELGAFNGREPDQKRWGFQTPRLNSLAGRLTMNPHSNWSVQWSAAHVDSPEQLHPGLDVLRMTASVTFNQPLVRGNWQTTAAWGRNKRGSAIQPTDGGNGSAPPVDGHVHVAAAPGAAAGSAPAIQNGLLVESTANIELWHTLYARLESAQKDDLFPPADPRHATRYAVSRATLGYIFDLPFDGSFRTGIGLNGSIAGLPPGLHEAYGSSPYGFTLFLRARLGS